MKKKRKSQSRSMLLLALLPLMCLPLAFLTGKILQKPNAALAETATPVPTASPTPRMFEVVQSIGTSESQYADIHVSFSEMQGIALVYPTQAPQQPSETIEASGTEAREAARNPKAKVVYVGHPDYPQIPCGVTRAELYKIAYEEYKKLQVNGGPLANVSLAVAFTLPATESFGNSIYKPDCSLFANLTGSNVPREIAFGPMQIYVEVHGELTSQYPDPAKPEDQCAFKDFACIKSWLLKNFANNYRAGYGILGENIRRFGITSNGFDAITNAVAGYKGFGNRGLATDPKFQSNYVDGLAAIEAFGGFIDRETGCFISINENEYLASPAYVTPKTCNK